MAIVILCLFGFGFLLCFLVGIFASWSDRLFINERISLILNPIAPSAKYYVFRQRVNWQEVIINFKMLVYVDILMLLIYGLMLGTSLYYAITDIFI